MPLIVVARLLSNLLRLVFLPFTFLTHRALRPRSKWVHVRIRSKVVEIEKPTPLFLEWIPVFGDSLPTSLARLRELVDLAVDDERIEGVVFELQPLSAGWASCQSLRELLVRLRENDREVVVYLPRGGGNRELYVASAATRIVASPKSQLSPLGLAASMTYFKGLLDRTGLELEVHRRAEYKTAVEPFTRDSMSDEQREQTNALLATVDAHLRESLASRPGVDAAKVDAFFEEAIIGAEEAVERGLIDGVGYEDELPTWLTEDRAVTPVVRAPKYLAWRRFRLFEPLTPERFVAVVPIHGAIQGGGPATRGGIQLASTIATLRSARRNPKVAGVVLHVDSPGGSVLASDLIHREVARLREKKPVVASFGNVAASGGYYVAACTDAVVAQPLTITGSIGVVSARLVTESLLERFGVSVDTIRKAPHADMMQRPGRWSEGESQIVDREIDAFYKGFIKLVAEGRGRPEAEIEPLARGRVWSGVDAQKKGLVDVLGGLETAVDEVRNRLEEKMSPKAARALRARLFRTRRLELPPAEPHRVGERAAEALLKGLDPRIAELWELSRGSERVLCYAAGIPKIE